MQIRKRIIKVIGLAVMLCLTGHSPTVLLPQEPTKDLSEMQNQMLWGLMQVWQTVKSNFVYFDQVPDLDWDASVQAAIPKVISAKNWDEYYLVLGELTALLNDGHTLVMPPSAFNGQNDNPPLELEMIEDKIILARVGDTEEIRSQNLYPGLELVEIGEGIAAQEYFTNHVERIFSGGTKQALEAFGLYLLLNGPKNSTVKLKFKDKENKTRIAEVTRTSTNGEGTAFVQRIFAIWPFVETRVLGDNIYYFKLSSFQDEQVVKDFKNELDKIDLTAIKGMILDIRYNFGGSSNIGYKIISNLIEQPVQTSKWKTRKYLPAFHAWGRQEEWYEEDAGTIKPADGKIYTGPLVVLTGPNTFSAAEDFIVPLDYSRRALLVGKKTAGSTGMAVKTALPGGGLLSVCAKRDTYPDGTEFVGYGIEPDIVVHPTQKDIYEKRDRVLEKAIEVLCNWEKFNKHIRRFTWWPISSLKK